MAEPTDRPPRIAYLMSWYPVVTETFILHEMLQLHRSGVDLEVFPLLGAAQDGHHPGAEELADRVHYHRALSWELVAAQLHWLLRSPRRYTRAWGRVLRGNARSPEFLAKALVVVPRAALLARRMQRLGIRHVHAHWATHPALAAYVIRELSGIGYSFTAHAHDLYLDRSMLAEKVSAARFVVTISRFNRALIARLFGAVAAAKTVVIRCGVDVRTFRPRPRRVPDGVFRIACVAALRDYKGHRWLVEACARLRDRGVAFECVLIGDGPERGAILAAVERAALRGRVRVLGNRPQPDVRALLEASDVVVHPSVVTPEGMMDGIPVALMEAMATGLPVIGTRVSGIPELVEHERTGLLVPEKDARALADALLRLRADPALAERLGRQGRRHVLERFSLAGNVARLRQRLLAAAGAEDTGTPAAPPRRPRVAAAPVSPPAGADPSRPAAP